MSRRVEREIIMATADERWEEHEDRFRQEWERSYPNTPWNDVKHGYRYGWEQANDSRYSGRDWSAVEGELRTSWSDWDARQHGGSDQGYELQHDWEYLKDCVRHGWERTRAEADKRT